MNVKDLDIYDSGKMYKIYDNWPKIAMESYLSDLKPLSYSNIDNIIFAGMGGSGTIGDIFSSILSKTNIHVSVVKGYLLPRTVDSNTLVIVTSISGNTEEALNVLELANKLKTNVIAFSSNGKMQKFCEKNNIEFRKITMEHSPRASFTKFFYSMINVLKPILPITDEEIEESIYRLEEVNKNISSINLTQNNKALNLAEWISGIPLIYFPAGLNAAAIRFKSSLQENSKIHVITEDIIEACHNGIVAWEHSSNVQPILLKGADDFLKTKQRWSIIEDFFDERKIDYNSVNSVDGNILSKLICLIYVLDYTSIYLAIKRKINPSTVDSINYIKNKLNSR